MIGPPYSYDSVLSAVITTLFDGSAAVVLFFAISGFVLAQSLARAPLTIASSVAFLARRLFRIMPSVWFATLLTWPLLHAIPAPPLDKFIGTALLTDAMFHVNAPLWSIRVEIAWSALFPILLWANLLGPLGMATVAGFSLWMCLTASFQGYWIYMLAFQLGIMVPTVGLALVRLTPARWRLAAFVFALAVLDASFTIERLGYLGRNASVVFESLASFYMISYLIAERSLIRDWLLTQPARFIGRISFLRHLPVPLSGDGLCVHSNGWCRGQGIHAPHCSLWSAVPAVCPAADVSAGLGQPSLDRSAIHPGR